MKQRAEMFYRQFTDRMNNINTANQIIARSNDVSASSAGPSMLDSIKSISSKDEKAGTDVFGQALGTTKKKGPPVDLSGGSMGFF